MLWKLIWGDHTHINIYYILVFMKRLKTQKVNIKTTNLRFQHTNVRLKMFIASWHGNYSIRDINSYI